MNKDEEKQLKNELVVQFKIRDGVKTGGARIKPRDMAGKKDVNRLRVLRAMNFTRHCARSRRLLMHKGDSVLAL